MKLSKHFTERWEERVGVCHPGKICEWVKNAIVVQQFRKTYSPRGIPLVIPELRWIPEMGAIVKRDAQSDTLITVVTANCREGS